MGTGTNGGRWEEGGGGVWKGMAVFFSREEIAGRCKDLALLCF